METTAILDTSEVSEAESSPFAEQSSLSIIKASEHEPSARDAPRPRSSKSKSHQETQHKVQPPEGAETHEGVVVFKEERKRYGFIKCNTTEVRYFFHMKDALDNNASAGAQVKFLVARDPSTGKDVACNVQTMSERITNDKRDVTKQLHEEKIPGVFTGNVIAMPQGPSSHRIDDGMIYFLDEDGQQQQAMFGAWRVDGNDPISLGCQVEFQLSRNPSTKVLKASYVKPLLNPLATTLPILSDAGSFPINGQHITPSSHMHGDDVGATRAKRSNGTATNLQPSSKGQHLVVGGKETISIASSDEDNADYSAQGHPAETGETVQYGRIASLKKEFGFIRQVSRQGDLFFHFSRLEGFDPEEDPIKVGDNVQFILNKDKDGRASAHHVARAPDGAVVFDVISTTVYKGIVLEKPISTKQYVHSSGVLEYSEIETTTDVAGDAGKKVRIIFSASDCKSSVYSFKPGDHVTFKVATNIAAARAAAAATVPGAAQMAGKRAVEVAVVSRTGHVVKVNQEKKFGFIEHPEEQEIAVDAKGDGEDSASNDEKKDATTREHDEEQVSQSNDEKKDATTREHDEEQVSQSVTVETVVNGESVSSTENVDHADASSPASLHKKQQQRIFFHFSEVSKGRLLKPGDEVSFIMHTNLKSGDMNASRVKRIKEGTHAGQPQHKRESSTQNEGIAESIPEQNPNKTKYVGNLQLGGHRTQAMPKMPDGTPGFSFGRGKALESLLSTPDVPGSASVEASSPSLSIHDLFAGLYLKGIGPSMTRSLSVEAKPFVPRSTSSVSLGDGVLSMENRMKDM